MNAELSKLAEHVADLRRCAEIVIRNAPDFAAVAEEINVAADELHEIHVHLHAAMSATPQAAQPPSFPTGSRYTVERHGDGWAIYRGRDHQHHGLNLGHLTECSAELAAMIEGGLNATPHADSRPAVPLLPCPVCGGEAIAHQDKLAGMSINFRHHAIAQTPEAEKYEVFADGRWQETDRPNDWSFSGYPVRIAAAQAQGVD